MKNKVLIGLLGICCLVLFILSATLLLKLEKNESFKKIAEQKTKDANEKIEVFELKNLVLKDSLSHYKNSLKQKDSLISKISEDATKNRKKIVRLRDSGLNNDQRDSIIRSIIYDYKE